MTVHSIYRVCVWLPLIVPAAVVAPYVALGIPLASSLLPEVLAYSVLVGGVPYALLGAWATWWIGGRPEAEIRRLMFRAPFIMVALFAPLALLAGLALRAPGPYAGIAALGSVLILLLGYGYVGLTVLLREELGPPRESIDQTPRTQH